MPFAAVICDRYGRKWGIASTAFVAILGATIQGAAVHEAMFCVGRFVVGFSITLGSVAGPIYVAEVAHPSYRARLTSLYGAFWYVGAILASISKCRCFFCGLLVSEGCQAPILSARRAVIKNLSTLGFV